MSLNINIPEYGVTQFNKAIKNVIEENFSYVRIKGEISEIKVAAKGQIYITLINWFIRESSPIKNEGGIESGILPWHIS